MLIFLIGVLIGCIGYLMVNNINLAVMELSAREKTAQLCWFIFLTLLFELIYCYFSLYGLNLLMQYRMVITITQYISVVFLLLLGFWSLFEKNKDEAELRTNIIRRGYWSVIVHPQQVPFWFFWGILLIGKNYLKTDNLSLFVFGIANAIGTLFTLMAYSRYGNRIMELLRLRRGQLKNLVGVICILSSFFLLYDILK